MSLKENANRIHANLLDLYDTVEVFEKSEKDTGNYLEYRVINENKELIIKIVKENLNSNMFSWSYLSNPDDDSSLVERFSSVDAIGAATLDIFEKNRFSSDYLKKINS